MCLRDLRLLAQPFHFLFNVLTLLIDYVYDFCHLADPDVGPTVLLRDVDHMFPCWSVRPQVCLFLFGE